MIGHEAGDRGAVFEGLLGACVESLGADKEECDENKAEDDRKPSEQRNAETSLPPACEHLCLLAAASATEPGTVNVMLPIIRKTTGSTKCKPSGRDVKSLSRKKQLLKQNPPESAFQLFRRVVSMPSRGLE